MLRRIAEFDNFSIFKPYSFQLVRLALVILPKLRSVLMKTCILITHEIIYETLELANRQTLNRTESLWNILMSRL